MSRLRSRGILILGSVLFAVSFVSPGIAEQAAPADPERAAKSPDELVRQYRRENEKLRARVKQLEAEVEALKKSRAITLAPQPAAPAVPPTWKPFQFNGATYYMVPLETSAGGPAARLLTDGEPTSALVKQTRP